MKMAGVPRSPSAPAASRSALDDPLDLRGDVGRLPCSRVEPQVLREGREEGVGTGRREVLPVVLPRVDGRRHLPEVTLPMRPPRPRVRRHPRWRGSSRAGSSGRPASRRSTWRCRRGSARPRRSRGTGSRRTRPAPPARCPGGGSRPGRGWNHRASWRVFRRWHPWPAARRPRAHRRFLRTAPSAAGRDAPPRRPARPAAAPAWSGPRRAGPRRCVAGGWRPPAGRGSRRPGPGTTCRRP